MPKRVANSSVSPAAKRPKQEASRPPSATLIKQVTEAIHCPICVETPDTKWLQCCNGHVFCQPCYSRCQDQTKCFECRTALDEAPIRNLVAEKLVATLRHARNGPGCKEDFFCNRLTCRTYSSGAQVYTSGVQEFEGAKGSERLVRATFPWDEVREFEGEQGSERKVRATFSSVTWDGGEVQEFEGERNSERKVRATFLCGRVQEYEGDKGSERIVRASQHDCVVRNSE